MHAPALSCENLSGAQGSSCKYLIVTVYRTEREEEEEGGRGSDRWDRGEVDRREDRPEPKEEGDGLVWCLVLFPSSRACPVVSLAGAMAGHKYHGGNKPMILSGVSYAFPLLVYTTRPRLGCVVVAAKCQCHHMSDIIAEITRPLLTPCYMSRSHARRPRCSLR